LTIAPYGDDETLFMKEKNLPDVTVPKYICIYFKYIYVNRIKDLITKN